MIAERYRPLEPLGRGGGQVYLGTDTLNGQDVAIKGLPVPERDPVLRAAVYEWFEQQRAILVELSHPNLVPIYDCLVWQERLYLITGVAPGTSLSERLANLGAMKPAAALEVGRQLSDLLRYLHSQSPPVILGNLKPGNIMLNDNQHVTVVDVGLTMEIRQGTITRRLVGAWGTPGFAALEQSVGRVPDERADVHALAAVLYTLVAGRPPAAALDRFAGIPLAPVPLLSADINAVLAQALEPLPSHRFRSVWAFAQALEEAQERHHAAPAEPPAAEDPYGLLASGLVGRERVALSMLRLEAAGLTSSDAFYTAYRKRRMVACATFAATVEPTGRRMVSLLYDEDEPRAAEALLNEAFDALAEQEVAFIDYVWREGRDHAATLPLLRELGFQEIQDRVHLVLDGSLLKESMLTTPWSLHSVDRVGDPIMASALTRALEVTHDRRLHWGVLRFGVEAVGAALYDVIRRLGWRPELWQVGSIDGVWPAACHIGTASPEGGEGGPADGRGARQGPQEAHIRILEWFDTTRPRIMDLVRDVLVRYAQIKPTSLWVARDYEDTDMIDVLLKFGFEPLGRSVVLVAEL